MNKSKSGEGVIEFLFGIVVTALICWAIVHFWFPREIEWVSRNVDVTVNQKAYLLKAKSLADTLPPYERETYGDDNFDPEDEEILAVTLGYTKDVKIEEIPLEDIWFFVKEHESENQ